MNWIETTAIEVPEWLQSAIGGHPLVVETLVRRGFTTVEAARAFLDPDYYRPAPPTDLPNMIRAAERLERAIREGETICVWGDFDVDGQTSTTILVSTLRDLGAVVRYHVPNRKKESHGVNLPVLKRLIAEGVQLVLTCDTGVTAHEPIAYARAHGVDVVVTDHHNLPPTLPDACAVVNPKMLPDDHPLRELPGVGCAYKLAEALYDRAGRSGDVGQYVDLVALGIVSDVAVQTGDTRYLLQRGLDALRHTQRVGLRALMESAELVPDWLTEEHIGFVLAPRLNSLGRLADATVAIDFLTTDDWGRARILTAELEGLNARRKLLCDQVAQAAEAQIEQERELLEDAALVLSHASWPAGVIGVVAGRLAERYQRPVVLISAPPGEPARGSARSVEGCNIQAAIAAHGDMLISFGGHPMAAGLTIEPERIPEFRQALSRTVREMIGDSEKTAELHIDGALSLADLSLDLVEQIERLAPFGPGNPSPVLVSRELTLTSYASVGRSGEHLQLTVEDRDGVAQRVIWWHGATRHGVGGELEEGRFDLAYTVRASDYRGQRDVQVEWVDARLVEPPTLRPSPSSARRANVVDYRQEPYPGEVLERLREQHDVQVWSEAGARAEVAGQDRYGLSPGRALAVWTVPPGPHELRTVLDKVAPETIYLFGMEPDLDRPEDFLRRLVGLIKHALKVDDGRVRVTALAAATAQRETTVRAGLAWLVARGDLTVCDGMDVLQGDCDEVHLAAGDQTVGADFRRRDAHLRALLEETAAYRAHFKRADKDTLA